MEGRLTRGSRTRWLLAFALLVTAGTLTTTQAGGAVSPDVVVSQVYGGGGNAGATYTHDFIELHNRSDAAVSLAGWSVQYASAAGSTWLVTALSGTIAPGGYYLVQQAAGTGGTTPLPTPDAVGSVAMSATAGKVAVTSAATALAGTCPTGAAIVDFVGYGATANCFEGPGPAPTLSNTTAAIRNGAGAVDTDDNAADFSAGAPAPRNSGAVPDPDPDPELGLCGDPATAIHAVQGSGPTSPLTGRVVVVEGVVVGDFQNNAAPDHGNLNGFHVQEEDADNDADPATSEGLFVFAPNAPDVASGDLVRVLGTVTEFGTPPSVMTELTNVTVVACAAPAPPPAATTLTLPAASPDDFERVEGMLVVLPQDLFISEFFDFDRFNEVVLTSQPQFQPTAVAPPGPVAEAIAVANSLDRITLDDGRSTQNPDPALHPNGAVFDLGNRFRGGDTVAGVTGVIDHSFGRYRVQPTEPAGYTARNLRPEAPADVGGRLTVASFNVLNYFTTIDTGVPLCGPAGNQECRGADTPEELERQRDKILAALLAIDADIVGLIEIENDDGASVADLVAGLNAGLGAGTYAYVDTGTIGTDAIKLALIYKPAQVAPVGAHAILDASADARFVDTANRPMLAQTFREVATGGVVTVAVNHLKSKGSGCGPGDDDPLQGNCNRTRTMAAQAIVDWLATDPTGSGDPDHLVIGDLNAYDKEDPITTILAGADDTAGTPDDFSDLVAELAGEHAYSYRFDGQLGYLDHALAIASLRPQVTGTTTWAINADEPDILDYDMTFKQPPQDALFEPNAYRSSDHDPVLVGLDLTPPMDCSTAVPSVASLWPPNHRLVPVDVVGVMTPGGVPAAITVTGIRQDEAVDAAGSGATAPDGTGVGTPTAEVRAERVEGGNGRVYRIEFTAADRFGNSCTGAVSVGVPNSRRGVAVDDGAVFDSTGG